MCFVCVTEFWGGMLKLLFFLKQQKDHVQARIFWHFFSQPDVSCPLIQGEGARWHCAARREITERSEEAPAAEAAQPSCNEGNSLDEIFVL